MTAAEIICDMAGISVQEVCKRACISEGRFKQLARGGKAPDVAIQRLCNVLGDAVDPMIFIFGYERWKQLLGNKKNTGNAGTLSRRRAGKITRPADDNAPILY